MTPDALRDHVLGMWSDLEWRHHGTGMLQAYVPGRKDVRVHVWEPILLLPGMTESGGMHNHRFAFRSALPAGSLAPSPLRVTPNPEGAHAEWQIDLASNSEDKDLTLVRRVSLARLDDVVFSPGAVYSLPKWAFHHARPINLAVTFVEISDKSHDMRASLIAPAGKRPVAAFGNPMAQIVVEGILLSAREALEAANG